MPMKLNVGVSRKVGLPDYSSVGASCNLEVELDAGLLERDLEGFHSQIRNAYMAAHQAVHDELARLQTTNGESRQNLPSRSAADCVGSRNGHERTNGNSPAPRRGQSGQPRSSKPATPNQVKAIHAIARRQEVNLVEILRHEYEVDTAQELTLRQASALIDELKNST
jgi:hypothetical protein